MERQFAQRCRTVKEPDGRLLDKICHPTTWLNQGRWEDEIEAPEREDVTSGMTPEELERWAALP